MRKLLLLLSIAISFQVNAQNIDYYLPKNVTYDANIPTPKSIIGHEVGQWHVTHDRLVSYMKAIAAASNRVKFQSMGFTYEGREQLLLIFSSSKNIQNLDAIQQQHYKLTEANESSSLDVNKMPLVVWIGNSIHGNESSGANAALLDAYYLAAAQGTEIDKLLENTIILLDPSFNPDGLNRFASWVNSNKSQTQVSDPNSRELNEIWPSGRFNHYWFDLNRDWLPAQHVESQNRLKFFHQWKPNILTDHHEMGSNSTFFFQPGVPSRVNPNTPLKNQQLTAAIGNYHAKFLDSIGSLYFTKEGYDDYYYGKGSTYPDANGAVGILFEQASSRGHAQETENGLLTFPFSIRNQFTTALSTLEAAKNLRVEMLSYQRDFFKDVVKEAETNPVKAYVFSDVNDEAKIKVFVEMMQRHQINIYQVNQDIQQEGKTFKAGYSYIVPTNQKQYKIIKTIFEKVSEYKDSLFYDVTAWTMPLAFGLKYAEVRQPVTNFIGKLVHTIPLYWKINKPKQPGIYYAFAFRWDETNAASMLYWLQSLGVQCKVTTQKFSIQINGTVEVFDYGSIIIPMGLQKKKFDEMQRLIEAAQQDFGINVYGISSGLSSTGIDLGSASFSNIKVPKIMLFAGTGTSPTDAGEIWHLLDTRFNMPVTIVDVERFAAITPSKYNVIIMPSGTYTNLNKDAQDKLKVWVTAGGTLIATEDAVRFLATNGFTKVLFKDAADKKDSTLQLPYYLRSDEQRAKEMTGSIFEARLDLTHPLCYGYHEPTVSIFKSNTLFMDQNNDPYDSPVMYTDNPLQSGYLYRGYKDKIKNTAAINIDVVGKGKIISMVDNLNFRAFWLGTSKMFMNAVYFGDLIKL
jgi:hypothetical protein